MEAFRKVIRISEDSDLFYEIDIKTQDQFYVLPTPVTFNEKWDATRIKAKVTIRIDSLRDPEKVTLEFTIVETGKVLGMESVETPAGTFEDCLKIEYQTKTEVKVSPSDQGQINQSGESVTTLWVCPNVGIVKFHQETEDILLKVIPQPQVEAATMVKTLELKKYEVKSTGSGNE